ncbi:MAG: sortase domain-containing protein [Anaerolineae bacterium]
MQSRVTFQDREHDDHGQKRRHRRRAAPHLERGLTLLVFAALLAVVSVSCQPLALVPAQSLLASLPTLEALPPAGKPALEPSATLAPTATEAPSPTEPPTAAPTPTAQPSPTLEPTATQVPPTDTPPTAVPPTAVPPTAVPAREIPPTDVPPTAVPPTAVPPAPLGPASTAPTHIEAPAIGLSVPVVAMGFQEIDLGGGVKGTGWLVPVNAAGWQEGSALPWNPGNMVICGHSNTGGAVFRGLGNLNLGDLVLVHVGKMAYPYTISESVLVREAGASVEERIANGRWIAPTADERLTLITCWPPDGASHRLILVARPVR